MVENERQLERYINSYKKIDKIKDRERYRETPTKDPIISYLKEVSKSH